MEGTAKRFHCSFHLNDVCGVCDMCTRTYTLRHHLYTIAMYVTYNINLLQHGISHPGNRTSKLQKQTFKYNFCYCKYLPIKPFKYTLDLACKLSHFERLWVNSLTCCVKNENMLTERSIRTPLGHFWEKMEESKVTFSYLLNTRNLKNNYYCCKFEIFCCF